MPELQENTSGVRRLTVDAEQAGQRIDNFLRGLLKGVPKSHIYRILRRGEVRVNRGRIRADYRLATGDSVRVPPVRVANREAAAHPGEWALNALREAVLYEELGRVAEEGVTDAELAKAKRNVAADFWRQMATINGKAGALGNYEVFHGDFRKLSTVPDDYEKVSRDELRELAGSVFDARRRTVGVMRGARGESS